MKIKQIIKLGSDNWISCSLSYYHICWNHWCNYGSFVIVLLQLLLYIFCMLWVKIPGCKYWSIYYCFFSALSVT